MNKLFLPNTQEERLIQIIQTKCRNEFVTIRLTKTMLAKSIMDASEGLRNLLINNHLIDFGEIEKRDKVIKTALVLSKNEIIEKDTSYYRPETKNGDPRFWIYGFKKISEIGTLIYFTYFENRLVAIPLVENEFETALNSLFKVKTNTILIEELKGLIIKAKAKGFIKSMSSGIGSPKDVGNTLELELGLTLNSIAKADYKGEIEIKTKRKDSGTKDSLFSCVPDWEKSKIKSAADMILKYGYLSKKHPGFNDLYVTVGNIANPQGLFLEPQNRIEQLFQYYSKDENKNVPTCVWDYSKLKEKLTDKHPTTVWIVAEEEVIDGHIHFHYQTLQLTQNPIFSQFISLIGLGTITYDWRGKVKPDKTGYRDHGHGFRISPKNRHLLFGETTEIII
jgi:MvaI/BcnI restriction endonuclease family protein